ncbi:MAG TPA: TonB-dependent receptor [Candidatus Acidoferrales bacterium]|nr:TonB-dependent receptor [Candidatus Acidoferrales bacterium]HUK68341.1 TonB-dependent receptor [Streptosporangiaceae bacterium]
MRARLWTCVSSSLFTLFAVGPLGAQGTTGKIEGTVKDSAGTSIAGAQVQIVGSAFRAVTDEKGYYFINNLPAGTVTVRAQYIGYAPNEVRGVRVLADQTMTVNALLAVRAVEIAGITITEEQNPIVPRDQVTSKPTIQGETIQQLPVDAVSEVLRLEPGVVESDRGLSIRGSRPGEQATYIDGVLIRNFQGAFSGPYGGARLASSTSAASTASTTTVGTNALEEASVTTGATGARFGEAEGGVVSLVTRAGGPQYHGSASYATDNVSGQVYGTGLNRIEASAGGPIPAVMNLTFFAAATLQGQQNSQQPLGQQNVPQFQLAGYFDSVMVPLNPGNSLSDSQLVRLPRFTQYASGCSGAAAFAGTCKSTRLLNANSDQTTLDSKLQYTYGTGSRLSVTYHVDRNQGLSGINYDPSEQMGNRALAQALIASWTQNLSSAPEHALELDAALSWQKDQYILGFVRPSWMENHHDPFGWYSASNIQFLTDFSSFPIDDQLIQDLRLGTCRTARAGGIGACIPYLGRNDLVTASAYRFNPYGLNSTVYASQGIDNGYPPQLTRETRLTGRANIDWQANRYNRIQAGFDFASFHDLAWSGDLVIPFAMDAYIASPTTVGLYAQDRLDLGDMVLELGLRYDRMDTGILYPRVPGRVFTDPLRSSTLTLAQKLATSYTAQDSVMARACDADLAAADSAALATCNFFKARPQSTLSPTLRVSFPVTDRTAFRLSYSHQVQTPDVSLAAIRTNIDISNTETSNFYGRPLGYGKTIMFEFGIRHAFSDDMVLDISAYNKDMVSEVAGRVIPIYDPFIGGDPSTSNESITTYTNQDFGSARGVDVRLDRRFGAIFQGTISYTYQTAKSTGSDPSFYLSHFSTGISAATGQPVQPPQAVLTTSDNRTHTIAGNLAASFPRGWKKGKLLGVILENAGLYATFRFASGLPYTLIPNGGIGVRGPGNGFGASELQVERINSSTMPWIKNVDLRVTRGFQLAGQGVSVFADFRNLFNWKNLTSIFAETGDVVNSLFQANAIEPQISSLTQDAGQLWKTKSVVTNGVTQTLAGVDLSDCSKYPYGDGGIRGPVDCLMLRQAELRWGNGDQFFTIDEITRAYNAWYDRTQGPQSFNGPGFDMRLGVELNF